MTRLSGVGVSPSIRMVKKSIRENTMRAADSLWPLAEEAGAEEAGQECNRDRIAPW